MSEDAWHVVLVPDRGHIICSCAGVDWCSHIDATLVAGERAMVAPEDVQEANRAQIAARGRLGIPEGWQAHWRTNRRWRGLPPVRTTMLDRSRQSGMPMISIEGRGNTRNEIVEMSLKSGWLVSPRTVKGCLFHVAPSSDETTSASETSRQTGVPIASYAEWRQMCAGLAKVLAHEIGLRIDTNHLQDES